MSFTSYIKQSIIFKSYGYTTSSDIYFLAHMSIVPHYWPIAKCKQLFLNSLTINTLTISTPLYILKSFYFKSRKNANA